MLPSNVILTIFTALVSQGNLINALPQGPRYNSRFLHSSDSIDVLNTRDGRSVIEQTGTGTESYGGLGKRVPPTAQTFGIVSGAIGLAGTSGTIYGLRIPIQNMLNQFRSDPTGRIALLAALRADDFTALANKEFKKRNNGRNPTLMDEATVHTIATQLRETANRLRDEEAAAGGGLPIMGLEMNQLHNTPGPSSNAAAPRPNSPVHDPSRPNTPVHNPPPPNPPVHDPSRPNTPVHNLPPTSPPVHAPPRRPTLQSIAPHAQILQPRQPT